MSNLPPDIAEQISSALSSIPGAASQFSGLFPQTEYEVESEDEDHYEEYEPAEDVEEEQISPRIRR